MAGYSAVRRIINSWLTVEGGGGGGPFLREFSISKLYVVCQSQCHRTFRLSKGVISNLPVWNEDDCGCLRGDLHPSSPPIIRSSLG